MATNSFIRRRIKSGDKKMSKVIFTLDSSDKNISKKESRKDGYLKSFVFRTWLTGKPEFVCGYTLDYQGKEIMAFRDKEELKKFSKILLKEVAKTKKQAINENGQTFFNEKKLNTNKRKTTNKAVAKK